MAKRLGGHLRSNAVGYVALFVALGGTGAWAVDKITSKEIAKGAVRSKHVAKNAIKSKHLKDGTVTNADIDPAVLDGLSAAITGDILGQVVQGEGRLLSAHDAYAPQSSRDLLELPGGLGTLTSECRTAPTPVASVGWENRTQSEITFFSGDGSAAPGVVPPGQRRAVASHYPSGGFTNVFGSLYLARGAGASRATAVVHAMPIQAATGGPCTFDVQVVYQPGD